MISEFSRGVKVPKRRGEPVRRALLTLGALDRSRKIFSKGDYICLPVLDLDRRAMDLLVSISEFEVADLPFQTEPEVATAQGLLGFKPSFDVVGDIAIVDPEDAEKVASALMTVNKSIRTVIAPVSDVEGEFRTRRFWHVTGEDRTSTIHKEHGLRYKIDLQEAYFTPRLGTERLRIISQTKPSDVVLDMFAGVGPFALPVARRCQKVIAIDKNPLAVKYMRENALMNKIDNIEIFEGDARDLAVRYECTADQVIMNLPHSASEFLDPAIRAAKDGGIVHYYAMSPEEDLYGDLRKIERSAEKLGANVELAYKGIVRSYSPRRYNVVIDFRVLKPGTP